MDITATIHSKISKTKSSLIQLNDEILIATKYLVQLRENSAAVVKNLTNITTPSAFLEEFLNVNSFLLKAMSFLSEINCKFEMLCIHERSVTILKSSSKYQSGVITSEITDKSKKNLKSLSPHELKSIDGNKTTEALLKPVVLHDQRTVNEKNSMKNRSKKSEQHSKNNDDDDDDDDAKNTTTGKDECKSSCKNTSVDDPSCKSDTNNSSKVTKSEQKNDKHKKLKLGVSVDTKDNAQPAVHVDKGDVKITSCQNEKALSLQTIDSSNLSATVKVIGTSFGGVSNSLADSLSNNIPSSKVSHNMNQLSGNIPVAEVVPTKIKDCSYDAELTEDFNCTEGSNSYSLKEGQPKPENEYELDDIKPAKLVRKLGKEYDIVVEHIKSPSEFYVSIIDPETNLLMEIEKKLKLIPAIKNNACRAKKELTKDMLRMKIGNYGLVYSKCEEMWCRAKITNWCLNYNDDFVNVFLLDYGESKCISTDYLQPIPNYLKQYPPFTVRCHLYDVFPVGVKVKNCTLSWEKETIEMMMSLTENSRKVRIKVAANDSFHSPTSLPVTLWLVDQDNECVNEILVRDKYAIHASGFEKLEEKSEILEAHLTENEILNNWDPMKEDFESYQNSYDLDINDPSAVIYGYVGKDYERVCKHFAETGYCFKGQACKKEHKMLDRLGFTTDQEEVYQSAINILSVPPPKSIVKAQVTCLLNCNKFFCFLEGHNGSSHEEDLKSLLVFMNQKENILQMKKLVIPPSSGQIVIARYSQDKAWYRARVLESQPENDQYTVLFVDYGNKESLPLSDIRAIEARYLHLPFQAVECCIYGIDPNPNASEEVMDYIRQRIDDGLITIEVVARLPGENINLLVNVFDREGENIGKELIAKNLVVFKNEMIINSASESMPG